MVDSIAEQLGAGNTSIMGVMIESNIKEGNQKLDPGNTNVSALEYGKSVTDACIDLPTTAKVLDALAEVTSIQLSSFS